MKSQRRPKLDPKEAAAALANRASSMQSLKSNNEEANNDPTSPNYIQPKVLLKPPDQVQLTEAELGEEFTRILNANNPHAVQNVSRFNHKERVYKSAPNVDHLIVHYEFDGYLLYKGDEKRFGEEDGTGGGLLMSEVQNQGNGSTANLTPAPAQNDTVDDAAGDEEGGAPATKAPQRGVIRNQFNYSERATQTFNNTHRDRSTNTEPPPQKTFSASVTQWEIFDAYVEDELLKEKIAKEKSKVAAASSAKSHKDEEKIILLPNEVHNEDIINRPEFAKSAKILERMANQNSYDDIAHDYKYWEDASDEFREGKGTLLPLWKFVCEKDKRKQVTALCWSPDRKDLFAVGYGSYDFLKQGPGLISCFTLKNPSYPDYIYQTESGVMCLDFHKQHTSLIAVGLYDGTVLVYDLQKKTKAPVYKSSAKSGKHTDPVWQVIWGPDDLDGNTNFYSISSDGRVTQWTLLKNELIHSDVIKLKLDLQVTAVESAGEGVSNDAPPVVPTGDDEKGLFGLAGGSCLDFNRAQDHLFVVGTEEGKLHKCSKAYNNQYLKTFEGHQMGVYSVRYNPFSSKSFLSASADWTVKLWDHDQVKPIMTFDLNSPVGDIAWAPYSSTVFAAASSDGKLYVYDLNENKYEPICEQQIVRKAKLTHLAFNPTHPILLVGDDKGTVVSMKLSPNLRKTKRAQDNDIQEFERIERIMAIVSGASTRS